MKKELKDEIFMEIRRQSVHAAGIFIIPVLLFAGVNWGKILLGLAFFLFLTYSLYRLARKEIKKRFIKDKGIHKLDKAIEKNILGFERKKEYPLQGVMIYFFSLFVVSLFSPQRVLFGSIMILAFGDSVSTFVGKIWGKHKLHTNRKKSYEGSLAFFAASFLSLLLFVNPLYAFLFSIVLAFVEGLPGIDDNLTVPIAAAILLSL